MAFSTWPIYSVLSMSCVITTILLTTIRIIKILVILPEWQYNENNKNNDCISYTRYKDKSNNSERNDDNGNNDEKQVIASVVYWNQNEYNQ